MTCCDKERYTAPASTCGSSILFEYQCIYGFFHNLTGGILLTFCLYLPLKSYYWYLTSVEIQSCMDKCHSREGRIAYTAHQYRRHAYCLSIHIISILMLPVCWICTFRNSKRYAEKLFVTFEKIVRDQ